MNKLEIAKKVGIGAIRLMTIGLISTTSDQLRKTNNNLMNDFNGNIQRGYEYYAKPKFEKLTIVKKNK